MNYKKIPGDINPPRLAEWLMKHMLWSEDQEAILENLREEFQDRVSDQGRLLAGWWYRKHALRSVLPIIGFEWK